MARKFTGAFTQQAALPGDAMRAAMSVLENGRLLRYNLMPGEIDEVALLEAEYRDWQGSSYRVAVTSGSQSWRYIWHQSLPQTDAVNEVAS